MNRKEKTKKQKKQKKHYQNKGKNVKKIYKTYGPGLKYLIYDGNKHVFKFVK